MHWSLCPPVELSEDCPGGPDFFRLAEIPERPKKGGKKALAMYQSQLDQAQPVLAELYQRACYDPDFVLPVAVKRATVPAPCVPGHIWGGDAGTGPRKAKVMLVGKWPNSQDVNACRLLQGVTGEILEQTLREAGFQPDDYLGWYVTNVCHHPGVDPSSDKMAAAWLRNWAPVLAHELATVQPDVVVCLGREAADAVLGEDSGPMKELFGRKFERSSQYVDHATGQLCTHKYSVLAVVSPASVQHDPVNRDHLLAGVNSLYSLLRSGSVTVQCRQQDWHVVYYVEELEQIVDTCIARGGPNPIIFVDAEWHGEYPNQPHSYLRTLQFSDRAGFACLVVLRHAGGKPAFCPTLDAMVPALRRLLVSTPERQVRVAGHHLRADLVRIHAELDPVLAEAMAAQFAPAETPEECRTAGGFDTMIAAHAYRETGFFDGFKLEYVCQALLGVPRWNVELEEWLHGKSVDGYGDVPDEILFPYALADVAYPRELVDRFIEPGGFLDADELGNECWTPYWNAQRGAQALLEMEMTGVHVDRQGAVKMCETFQEASDRLYTQIRSNLNWPSFNVDSPYDVREMLFGEQYRGAVNGESGRPEDALSLYLSPVKSSGKPSQPWNKIVARRQTHLYNPSTDKETLGILLEAHPFIGQLRDLKFVRQMLKMALRPPAKDEKTDTVLLDDDGEPLFDSGLIHCIQSCSRIYTHFFPTAETGRLKSARPNLQNLSKRRDKDYARILGESYRLPLRALITATPPTEEDEDDPWLLVDFDLRGAELLVTAIQSGDPVMIDHCQRSNLPEDHPNYYDIHSSVAVQAFSLRVPGREVIDKKSGKAVCDILRCNPGDPLPASKVALKLIGRAPLRIAAKTVIFGLLYGRGDEAVVRAVLEEGEHVTIEDAARLRQAVFTSYKRLPHFFEDCKSRVSRERYIRSCFGRLRHFPLTSDRETLAKLERESSNFPIQSTVADVVNQWMWLLYHQPGRIDEYGNKRYRFLLQLHDALLCECRASALTWFCNEVIPQTLDSIEIWPCDMSGHRRKGSKPFKMGTDIEVQSRWGVPLSRQEGLRLHVPESFLPRE